MLFVFEEFELDDRALELRRHGEPVAIGEQATSLLLHLLQNRDRVVSREEPRDGACSPSSHLS